MRPGLPAWHNMASQNEKYAYMYQNMTSHHGLTKRVPHRQLRPNLRYVIHFPSSHNGLINCCNVSLRLIVFEQYFVYHSICPYCLRVLRSKAEFFVPSTLVAAMFRKSGMLDRSKCCMTLFICRNLPQEITVMIINTGQMCTVNYSGRNVRFKVPRLEKNVS